MAVIAVDFDGTLFFNSSEDELSLVPGAREFMLALDAANHEIVIHTCRLTEAQGPDEKIRVIDFLETALRTHDIPYSSIYTGDKLIADAYVDDRAVEFKGNWESVAERVNELLE